MKIKTFIIFVILGILSSLPFILSVSGVHWDDAYTFFRYAENIVNGWGFVYNSGDPYVGVTSILWTLILVPIKFLFGNGLPFISELLGTILYSISAGLWTKIVINETRHFWYSICCGIMIITNPLGIILAISGMDTALSIFIFSWCVYVVYFYRFNRPKYIGILLGIFFLTRPDALIFWIVFIFIFIIDQFNEIKKNYIKILNKLLLILGISILVSLPWVLIVFHYTGDIIPPTQIGKLLERLPVEHGVTYHKFISLDIISRIQLAIQNISALFGTQRGGIVILPYCLFLFLGVPVVMIFKGIRGYFFKKDNILKFLWLYSISLLIVFSFQFPLPMPRYIANIIPLSIACSFILGNIVLLPIKRVPIKLSMFNNIKSRTYIFVTLFFVVNISLLLTTLPRFIIHAREQQIRFEIGKWLYNNTPSKAVVALEPIGEIGYYSHRRIIDLGGLVSPSVWKYIEYGYGNADKMFEFLKKNKVDYLVDYPPETFWSLNNTVRKYKSHFSLQAKFGKDLNSYYIYKATL